MAASGSRPRDAAARWAPALVALVALLQYRVTILIHGPHLGQLVEASRGVTLGHPHWRVYQGRVLGPFALDVVHRATGIDLEVVFVLFLAAAALAFNAFVYLLARRFTGDAKVGLITMGAASLGFVLLLDRAWLFPWDLLDLLVFTAFGYAVASRRGDAYFLALFVPGILNREAAVFMGVWMVLDGLLRRSAAGAGAAEQGGAKRVILGGGMVAVGLAVVEGLRRWLFVSAAAVEAGMAQVPLGPLGFNRAWHNLTEVVGALLAPGLLLDLPVALAVLALPLWLVSVLRRGDPDVRPLAATILLGWAANVAVGLVLESRVWLWLLPQVVWLGLMEWRHAVR